MALRLPRLPRGIAITDKLGIPLQAFQSWWQSVVTKIEAQETAQDGVIADLATTQADLAATQADLAASQADLTAAQADIIAITGDLSTLQPVDATLTALAGLDAVAGLVEQTGADTFTKRAMGVAASTSVLTRADGDGRYATTSTGGDVGPSWTPCTFTSSATHYGVTVYDAAQTFAVAAGQRLEVEALLCQTSAAGSALFAGDGSNAFYITDQSDGNIVLYRYNGGAATSLAATGASATNVYAGLQFSRLIVNCRDATQANVYAECEAFRLPTAASAIHSTPVTFTPVMTYTIAVNTTDISKCYVRARVIG